MSRPIRSQSRFRKLSFESLEIRTPLAFSVLNADVYAAGFKLVADFNQSINPASISPADLVVDGAQSATAVNIVDADTVEFSLPGLASGTHTLSIAGGAITNQSSVGLDPFSKSFTVASAPQYTVKHDPRLQPGNAPLAGYAGSNLDQVDLLWQTIPAGAGTQDLFSVEYRPVTGTAWQTSSLNARIVTDIEGRVVESASITGLNWNSDYVYRMRHRRGDVIVGEYTNSFHTRLVAGDPTAFSFAAYGDSASGAATGFRQVQSRINQVNPLFSVLLGDNVYNAGSHAESDSRFDPIVNPEAAAWMAGHIDYLGLGNHDVGTSSGLPSQQNYSVPVPVAGVTAPAAPPSTELPEHSFSWDYGNVHFVTFDTNSYTDSARLDGLLKWVVADLSASTARWKIVYGHHPLAGVPDKPEIPGGNYYQQVVNRLKAAGVDLFMTGHSHTYSWTYPLTGQINGTATFANHGVDDHFFAGEGLPQLVSGLGGFDIRTGDYSLFPFVASGYTSNTPVPARFGFSKIDVTPNVLTISYIAADDGAVIDSFQLEKDVVQSTSFEQGVNGYTGTLDTFLHQNAPTINSASVQSLKVDGEDPVGFQAQSLLQFGNIFGSGSGQIPANATLRSATLQLSVTNGSVNNMNLHRMISTWSVSDTWNSRVTGIQADDSEAAIAPDTSSGSSQVGTLSFNVLPSLQTWFANPSTNHGWAILPTGSDGVVFSSSESTTKPRLIVTYVLPPASAVLNRQAFYNHSTSSVFGNGSGNPVNAIDPSKTALLPGQASSFANYTNYIKGLNGIVVDVANLTGNPTVADFQFATWNGIASSGFTALAAAPTITVLPNGGVAGSKRVKIEFADNAIRNAWLRVTMLANSNTNLSTNDVFYFGNAIGDMNVGNFGSPTTVATNEADAAAVRQNLSLGADSAVVTNIYDTNKDGRVNAIDLSLTRQSRSSRSIRYFTAPLNQRLATTPTSLRPSISSIPPIERLKSTIEETTEASKIVLYAKWIEKVDDFFSSLRLTTK